MSTAISQQQFDDLAKTMHLVAGNSDSESTCERIIDGQGCTVAYAVYSAACPTTLRRYDNGDREEYMVADGVAWPVGQYAGDANTDDCVRVYAVDEESAMALAQRYDDGLLQPDNTPLGDPGIVQAIA